MAWKHWPLAAVMVMCACGSEPDDMNDTDGGTSPACSSSIIDALEAAGPGDTVTIEDCSVTGPLSVGAGVTLQGVGSAVVVAPADGIAITLTPGTDSKVAGLRVESDGRGAISVVGAGAAVIQDTDIVLTRGVGIGIEDVTGLSMIDVTITGPVTAANAAAQSAIAGPDETAGATPWLDTASHGLVLVRTSDASLQNVSISGISLYGAQFVEATGTAWNGGGGTANLRTGLQIYGGSATLTGLTFSGHLRGDLDAPNVRAVEIGGGAVVTTTSLSVKDNEGAGVVQQSSQATHTTLTITGNGSVGYSLNNNTAAFHIDGLTISGNTSAGLAMWSASNVLVENGTLDDNDSTTGGGDGISAQNVSAPFVLDSLSLSNNTRAQIILDLFNNGQTVDSGWLQNITVSGSGVQYGVVVQNGDTTPTWDMGVTRSGVTDANDTGLYGTQCSASGAMLTCGTFSGLAFSVGQLGAIAPNSLIDNGLSIFGF